jgi:hypothetical protein
MSLGSTWRHFTGGRFGCNFTAVNDKLRRHLVPDRRCLDRDEHGPGPLATRYRLYSPDLRASVYDGFQRIHDLPKCAADARSAIYKILKARTPMAA